MLEDDKECLYSSQTLTLINFIHVSSDVKSRMPERLFEGKSRLR